MSLQIHPTGDYSFVPGIAPYSCGVISNPGFEIVHVVLPKVVSWRTGFQVIESFLAAEQRPKAALCAVSLRSPEPFTFEGFAKFNGEYAAVLSDWGVFVEGVNPVARTNVAPELVAPAVPSLYGFAYTKPCAPDLPATFVVAGAGELPEGVLSYEGIVRAGDTSPAGISDKADFVLNLMETRLRQLGVSWSEVTRTNVYTIHSSDPLASTMIQPRIKAAGIHGVTWHYSRPPIREIEFEMDVRGVRREVIIRTAMLQD